MAASFDTLTAARRLKEAGASEPMAAAIREARDFDLAQLATKADFGEVRVEIERLRSELSAFATKSDLSVLELRLIKWVIGVGVAAFVALSGVIWAATQVLLHAHP
jgi:hypothetical protein